LELWQKFWIDAKVDASRLAWGTADQALALQSEHHLMDGGRGNGEEPLDICFGRRSGDDERIGVDEGQVLTLLVCEAGGHGVHAT